MKTSPAAAKKFAAEIVASLPAGKSLAVWAAFKIRGVIGTDPTPAGEEFAGLVADAIADCAGDGFDLYRVLDLALPPVDADKSWAAPPPY